MHTVTGYSSSRLNEVKKYAVSGAISTRYFTSIDSSTDGVNINLTTEGLTASTYVYYVGGITYQDVIVDGISTTTFSFQSLALDDPNNFVNLPILKFENKQNMVENSQISSDVFIARQQQTVFEKNFRLRGIGSLSDMISYAGGNYFTIYNNT